MSLRMWWLALVLLAGCSRKTETPSLVEAAKPEPAKVESPKLVELDEKMQSQTALQVEELRMQAIESTLEVNGRLTVDEIHTFHVGAITDGRIVRVMVNPGDRVKRDQRLASMHSHDIHEARAEYRKALAESARLKTAISYATRQRDRYRRLYDLKAASLEQVEHAETELRNLQAAMSNSEAELGRTRLHLVEFLQVDPDDDHPHKEGEYDESDLIPVKSPADGIVLERKVTAGSVASAGEELFHISNLATLWMIAAVSEEHLGRMRIGQSVNVRVQAYAGDNFTGRITRIGDQLDAATRTVPVRVELANRGGKLKPEMYATAQIRTGASEPAIFVPESAVQQIDGNPVVFVSLGGGKFEPRPIDPGPAEHDRVIIRRGLNEGERVVTKGAYVLKSQLLKGSLGE